LGRHGGQPSSRQNHEQQNHSVAHDSVVPVDRALPGTTALPRRRERRRPRRPKKGRARASLARGAFRLLHWAGPAVWGCSITQIRLVRAYGSERGQALPALPRQFCVQCPWDLLQHSSDRISPTAKKTLPAIADFQPAGCFCVTNPALRTGLWDGGPLGLETGRGARPMDAASLRPAGLRVGGRTEVWADTAVSPPVDKIMNSKIILSPMILSFP
jgi:hypothetical protein